MTTQNRGPLRIGIVGVGFGAAVHVPGFLSEGWEVPVLWGRRVERARETAERLGVAEVAEDWRDLVARDDLDAVAIATPPGAHLEMVTAALEAGKHVLCEKPFALDAAEAEQMRALAEAQGRTAMVAHEFRFAPQRAQIKELLEQGYIGTPLLVSAELLMGRPAGDPPPLTWNARTAEGGGMLGGLGSHFIDGFRHWFGEIATTRGALRTARPDRTDPATGALVQADADDTFAFTLEFENGVVVSMTASSAVSPSQGGCITITGSDGVLVATQRGPNPEPDGVVLAGKSSDRTLEALPVPEHCRPFEDDRDHRLVAFRLLVREFERGIREGVSPSPSFEDGVRCQEVLDAIRESARG
ncbi:MAG: Gfo/Idh/MocA family oxidoreductase [Dehalococcoidia bacterium]|nr:Gfo/Idh/MocA family oxidoreductase [Dehalococcoidia bacterium]